MNRRTAVICAFVALALAATFAIRPVHADLTVRCTSSTPGTTVCRIDEPVVNKQLTDYPQVTFQPGDKVNVTAGGCVQTGGHGATWKRYVNPSGPNSNRLYWGTISIPGATAGLVRVSDAMGKTLTVATGIAPPLNLKLGYVDDDYSDNGYDSHDDGTENQCKNQPNAFVVLTIVHAPNTTSSCAGSSGTAPLDLAWTDCDPNGFPMNPRWQYEVANHKVPPPPTTLCPSAIQIVKNGNATYQVINFPQSCVQWPLTYDSGFWCGPHVNYFAATYKGPVDWWLKSTVGTDDDYNYRMFPANNEGLVGDNPGVDGMEIEFDSDETIDHFNSPLWNAFHSLVDNHNDQAQAQIKHKMAVVTSLIGFDCGHPSCASEEHPAYSMAVDMDNSNLANDQWGVFARNWGDEGFCSADEHALPGTDLKLLIPWLPGATNVAVLPDTQFYPFANDDSSSAAVPSPQITVAIGQGVLLDFTLPDPGQQLGVEGEVHLQWTITPAARTALVGRGGPIIGRGGHGPVIRPDDDEEKPENHLADLFSKMTAPQRSILNTRMGPFMHSRPPVKRARLPMRPIATVAKLPPPPHLARPVIPQAIPNPKLVQRNETLRKALCEVYGNNVPTYTQACAPAPKAH